jgi:hypothetical protein
MAVFTGVTTAVVALRIWAIHLTRKGYQLSDYLLFVAYVRLPSQPRFLSFSLSFRFRRI